MKRIPFIAGNWKMYKIKDEAYEFVYAVNQQLPNREEIETVICAPAPYLKDLVKREGENLRIGAQNMHQNVEGAYTGETSGVMLRSVGVEYVILGHSERRTYFYETDELVNLKLIAALKCDLIPILCVGEALETREAGKTNSFVKKQIVQAFENISEEEALRTIIAYEPIWAIGTGKNATPQQANETIGAIRSVLKELFSGETSEAIRIIYGGSVNTKNAKELLSQPEIDGALVGGASLDAQAFLEIVKAAE